MYVVPAAAALRGAVAEVERAGAVEGVRVRLGRLVALALDGLHVHHDRAARVDGLADALAQRVHVVAVDDADVGEAQLLEEHARHEQRLHRLLDVLAEAVGLLADGRDARHAALEVLAQPRERRVEADAVEVELQGADVGADRHLVVVEDHDQRRAQVPGLVHRLEGDAAGERPVAEHADDVVRASHRASLRRLDEAQAVADGRRGVAGADDVVRRTRVRLGKPERPPYWRMVPKRVAAAGEQLVRVALVADVPDDLVVAGSAARCAAPR